MRNLFLRYLTQRHRGTDEGESFAGSALLSVPPCLREMKFGTKGD